MMVIIIILIIKGSFFRCIFELGKWSERSRVGSEMHPFH